MTTIRVRSVLLVLFSCVSAWAGAAVFKVPTWPIEQLAAEQTTGGRGAGNDCPLSNHTRGQMAVFITKTFVLQ